MAIGVLRAAKNLGLNVPQDIAVTGFDNIATSQTTSPPLSTISEPLDKVNKEATKLLLKKLKSPQSSSHILLPSQFIKRGSSALEAAKSESERTLSKKETLNILNRYLSDPLHKHEFENQKNHGVSKEAKAGIFEFFGTSDLSANQSDTKASLADSHEAIYKKQYELIQLFDVTYGIWQYNSVSELMTYVASQLPILGIKQCYVILNEEKQAKFWFAEGERLIADATAFNQKKLVPESYMETLENPAIVLPLHSPNSFYGHMIVGPLALNLSDKEIAFFQITTYILRRNISLAVQDILQRQQIANYTSKLEALVKSRTEQLELEIKKQQKMQADLKKVNEKLALSAFRDKLTGIYNRAAFDDYFKRTWFQQRRDKKPLSLIFIDVDHFKLYNDTYGHIKGDYCLKYVAQVLKIHTSRPADFVARYGGEEFAILLPDTMSQGAEHIANSILKRLKKLALQHESSPVARHITVSMGIATLIPTKKHSMESFINDADKALYTSKQLGRNRYTVKESAKTKTHTRETIKLKNPTKKITRPPN